MREYKRLTAQAQSFWTACSAFAKTAAEWHAGEVLHVHIGREWLLPKLNLSTSAAVRRGREWRASTAPVLNQYEDHGEQQNWWPDFARKVPGHDTAMTEFDLSRL